ncbi:MAG: hypothetical protein ABIJ45_02440 [Candidatus Zixiibacteriota bacterium]
MTAWLISPDSPGLPKPSGKESIQKLSTGVSVKPIQRLPSISTAALGLLAYGAKSGVRTRPHARVPLPFILIPTAEAFHPPGNMWYPLM